MVRRLGKFVVRYWYPFIAIGVLVYFWATIPPWNGTWVKQGGRGLVLPQEITVEQHRSHFRTKHFERLGGIRATSLLCDGAEHVWSNYPTTTTYKAELNKNTLALTRHSKNLLGADVTETEHWSLKDGGKTLVIEHWGYESIYRRKSFWAYLSTATP